MSAWNSLRPGCRRRRWKRLSLVAFAASSAWLAGCAAQEKKTAGAANLPPAAATTTRAARNPSPPEPTPAQGELILFDDKTLNGWRESDFYGRGPVRVEDGKIILGSGVMTGVTWTNDIPKMNYEVNLDAMRVEGSDFFCGLTFPVGEDPCSLIVGGWGGGVVGLSSLDGEDAANNETTQYVNFENGRWYHVRLRVLPAKIQAWIDNDKVVDVNTSGRKISIRIEVEPSRPFGIATWSTTGALRNIRVRRL